MYGENQGNKNIIKWEDKMYDYIRFKMDILYSEEVEKLKRRTRN